MVGRHYPAQPIAGVGGVVVMDDGRVLLVRRRFEPAAGRWTLPGGAIELGEPAKAALAREILEETGLLVDVGHVIEVVDRISTDAEGRVDYHYVIVDYLCRARGGQLAPGSDVSEAALADPAALEGFGLTDAVRRIIAKGTRLDLWKTLHMTSSLPQSGNRAPITRDAAWAIVTEHVQSESLRKHLLAVEAAVRGYARMYDEDEEAWGFVALVHDFDYEKFPDQENHPYRGVEILTGLGYPEWVTRAILSHADYSGVPRESRLEKVLYACDEMAGFVTAAALVRPSRSVLDLEASSVIKRMKDKAFARAVSRDDLRRGADELGLPLADHITNVIGFLRERAEELGLKGQ